MATARRKWTHQGLQVLLVVLVLGVGWLLRQTQGAAIYELYALLSRPFQPDISSADEQTIVNAKIQELQERLVELDQQNRQLKTLLGYVEAQKQPLVTAPVIGRSSDDWWQQLIIGRGSNHGIQVGAAVTGIGGLVGRVEQVSPNTSRVKLVSNASSRIGVTVSRSRSMGFIKGEGSQISVMQFFEKVPDVRPGDVITTSSVSSLFPPGLPLGRVQSIASAQGPAPEAKIEFSASIDNLEWVLVHPLWHP
jgi:rod shape-determining protein MreC